VGKEGNCIKSINLILKHVLNENKTAVYMVFRGRRVVEWVRPGKGG
jgi:hypothetical protein